MMALCQRREPLQENYLKEGRNDGAFVACTCGSRLLPFGHFKRTRGAPFISGSQPCLVRMGSNERKKMCASREIGSVC
jgi:hypothetical protein